MFKIIATLWLLLWFSASAQGSIVSMQLPESTVAKSVIDSIICNVSDSIKTNDSFITNHNTPKYWSIIQSVSPMITAVAAVLATIFIPIQIRKQTRLYYSDRVLDLYTELDTNQERAKRKFVYEQFPKFMERATEEDFKIVREVYASMDRMAYQVLRKGADRRAAHDLYGRVLVRIVYSVWDWLEQDRQNRKNPYIFRYGRYAEILALQFAKKDLKLIKKWNRSDQDLEPRKLLEKAIRYTAPTNLVALENGDQVSGDNKA